METTLRDLSTNSECWASVTSDGKHYKVVITVEKGGDLEFRISGEDLSRLIALLEGARPPGDKKA